LERKIGIDLTVSSAQKKAFKKLCTFYFETFRIILNPSSVKKIKQHLARLAIQTKRLCGARNNGETQKTSKTKPQPPTTSKKLAKSTSRNNSYGEIANKKLK